MKTVTIASLATFAFLLPFFLNHVGKATALAGNVTVVVENFTDNKIFPRVVDGSSGAGTKDYPEVPPKGSLRIFLEHDKYLSLFFATGCSRDMFGRLRNCSSGDCREGSCTVEDQPVATLINYENGTFTTSNVYGYNFGLHAVFQCSGCECPSLSCIIPLSRCPKELRIFEEPGLLVACRAGGGLPSGQDCAAPSYHSHPSVGTTCLFKNGILSITVSSPRIA